MLVEPIAATVAAGVAVAEIEEARAVVPEHTSQFAENQHQVADVAGRTEWCAARPGETIVCGLQAERAAPGAAGAE